LSSRLAFHFRRASASLLPSAATYLAAPNELGGKAKKEGKHIRRRKKRTWRNFKNGFCSEDIMSKGYGFLWQMKILGSDDRYLYKNKNKNKRNIYWNF
jgi:hypothetical protein